MYVFFFNYSTKDDLIECRQKIFMHKNADKLSKVIKSIRGFKRRNKKIDKRMPAEQ